MKIPKLHFFVSIDFIKLQYHWIKKNPDFSSWATIPIEGIIDKISHATASLRQLTSGKEEKLLTDLSRLGGYPWDVEAITVYPTFLGPSFSRPLLLKVVEINQGELIPRNPYLLVGILLHELGHNLILLRQFPSRKVAEVCLDLLALKVLTENGYLTDPYREFSKNLGGQEKGITPDMLFSPTIRSFLEA